MFTLTNSYNRVSIQASEFPRFVRLTPRIDSPLALNQSQTTN